MHHPTSRGRSVFGAASAALFAAAHLALAQTPSPAPSAPPADAARKEEPKETVTSEVVVTATKTETEAWRTASSVTVIDRKQIEEKQFKLLPEALRTVPGLTIADRGTPGSVAGTFVRGTNSDQTLVVIDGRPIPVNLAGLYNIETLALDNVERIEVLRGPAASVYGGRTIGGVINIITRSGRGLEKPETELWWEGGSFDTFREGLGTRGSAGTLDWSVEFSRTDTQGFRDNSEMGLSNLSGNVGWQIAESLRFDLNARYYQADVGVPGPVTGFGANDPDDNLFTEFWSVSPRLVWDTTEWWQQTLLYQYGDFRQEASHFPLGLNNTVKSHTSYLEYQSLFRLADHWTATAGASMEDLGYSRFNDDPADPLFNPLGKALDVDQNETNWAMYLQSQLEILPGWNLLAGVRHDSYSDFDDETTWRVGTSVRIPGPETILHANYGTAFAPASPQNRESALNFSPGFLPVQPETSRGVEVGIEQPFANNTASVSVTWFRNDIKHLIQFDPNLFLLTQVDEARTEGFETGFHWMPCQSFGLDVDYTYLDAENLTDDTRLVRRPRHTMAGSLWVKPFDKLRLGIGGLYVINREDGFGAAQQPIEDYLVLRFTASYQICRNCEIFTRVENMTDQRYEETLGYPAPRAAAYAGLKFKF